MAAGVAVGNAATASALVVVLLTGATGAVLVAGSAAGIAAGVLAGIAAARAAVFASSWLARALTASWSPLAERPFPYYLFRKADKIPRLR